ncbi:MAG: hypothetical protein KY475_13050 [Planctomycetes bacterium]|nr:hypothetical protein [Planctomycetota bacterium]
MSLTTFQAGHDGNPEQRARLAVEIFDTVFRATETFEEVGAELAYLLGAILKDSAAEYHLNESPLYDILSIPFPDTHPIWNHFVPYEDSLPTS